ncbi:MFS transporter [Leucobacter aridicollis]|uniref:Putative proline/betaine transporter n=1 Tax=Leucobacter aridicollis TaxID=283878 RepID=A0A852RFF3_9MICO|nr:MFS transporter [Leucobacter aridicollis]MBL3680911.1 MFS transporter [Leucobacter aridicollis]NYD28086.1 MHS family proline/betaine transporter-like MFS transporter [Leucobacter aridicollis]
MSTNTTTTETENRTVLRRVLVASGLGTLLEYFDYASYSYLATTIAIVFFPAEDRTVALLSTFAVFALSFLVRPFGALLWGSLGDKIGRKQILATTIIVMSAATFLIGFLPGYAAIGVVAPILLLTLRVAQSFSASGEYAGAGTFVAEYAPAKHRGILTSVVPMAAAAGFLLASIMATVLYAALSPGQMASWGWRIPFFIAGPLGLIGLWLRARLEDTPQFRRLQERERELQSIESGNETPNSARWSEIRSSLPAMLKVLLVMSLNAGAYYLLLSYVPTFLIEEAGMSPASSTLVVTIGLVAHIALIPLMARFSDRIGRKRTLLISSASFILLSYPIMLLLSQGGVVLATLVLVASLVFFAMNDAVFPAFFTEMFGTKSRYLGFALPFNVGAMLFGGVAPLIGTWLIASTGNSASPAFFLIGVGTLSLVGLLFTPETARTDLVDVQKDVGTAPVHTL